MEKALNLDLIMKGLGQGLLGGSWGGSRGGGGGGLAWIISIGLRRGGKITGGVAKMNVGVAWVARGWLLATPWPP